MIRASSSSSTRAMTRRSGRSARFSSGSSRPNCSTTETDVARTDMAVATGVGRARRLAGPPGLAWAWLPTFLLIVGAVLTGTPALCALFVSPQKGYLNQLLRLLPMFAGDTGPLDIFSYGGLIFVSVTGWATLLAIFLIPAFRNMDAALEESARMCGASPRRTVMRILVPLLRPAILAAFILSLTRLLSSFETEVFLGTSSGIYLLTNKIYERMVQIFPPDFRTGMTMAVMLLVITFGLVLVNWRFLGKRDYTTVSGRGYSARPMALGKLRWVEIGRAHV